MPFKINFIKQMESLMKINNLDYIWRKKTRRSMSDVWDLKTWTQSLNATWNVINDYNQSLFPWGLRQFISWRSTLLYMCVTEFSLQLLLFWGQLISRCHFDGAWWRSNSATWGGKDMTQLGHVNVRVWHILWHEEDFVITFFHHLSMKSESVLQSL